MSSAIRKILVVDKDAGTAAAVRAALPPEGYTVVPAPDAASALKALAQQNLDAVVSELSLPDGDGLHLIIEARVLHPLVPRIVVTAQEDFFAAVSAINEAEVYRFLRKPIDTPSLRAAIEDALGRAESLHEAKGVREEAERRRHALADLETDHPGITMVSLGPEGYSLTPPRLRALEESLKGTRLGPHLAAALKLPGPEASG
jgi:DNA-binding NtrC family response regulator